MVEVIDLLSSSPPRPPTAIAAPITQKRGSTLVIATKNTSTKPALRRRGQDARRVDEFDSDGLSYFDDLDDWDPFPTGQPAKRRKLSPVTKSHSQNERTATVTDAVFELSSEPDAPCVPLPLTSLAAVPDGRTIDLSDGSIGDIDKNDVFRFSSSAPEPRLQTTTVRSSVLDLSSDNERYAEDPIESSSQPDGTSRSLLTRRTADLLAGLKRSANEADQQKRASRPRAKPRRSDSVDATLNTMAKFKQVTKPLTINKDDIVDSSQPAATAKSKSSVDRRDDKGEASERVSASMSKVEKAAQKQAERERKAKEKEEKAKEKQRAADIAEVNKSRTNKKTSAPEMIVDMPAALQGSSVGNQVAELMKQLDVNVIFTREEVDLSDDVDVSVGNLVRWRRKVVADYDEDLEIWKPLDRPRVSRENFVLLYLRAEEFVRVAVAGHSTARTDVTTPLSETLMKANIDAHVEFLRSRYPGCTLIYLLEGLAAWNRRSQNVKNKAYAAAVRSQIVEQETDDGDNIITSASAPGSTQQPPTTSSQQTSSRRTNASKGKKRATAKNRAQSLSSIDVSLVTRELCEDLLLHLQLRQQPLLIHHTTSTATSAAQIASFTTHLSTRPYRLAMQAHNLSSASFCMTTGQIRTGATRHETYVNMLQEVNRVTPSMAYGISAAGYDGVAGLIRGFRTDGNLMLQHVRKSVNRDGAWSDRRLGPMVSKRLCRVFTGTDPGVRDGIA